jgi:hypothetical protein
MIFDLKSFWNIYLYFIKNYYFFNYDISFRNLKYLIFIAFIKYNKYKKKKLIV